MIFKSSRAALAATFSAIFAAGSVFIFYATDTWGIGVFHDSIFYLDTAANVLAGKGLAWTTGGGALRPLTHFPPGYPLALAAGALSGIQPVTAARIQSAAWYGLNAALIWLAVLQATQRSHPAILATLVTLVSPVLLGVHLMAMSEPQYLALNLAALLFLIQFMRTERRPYFFFSAIAAALAALTRYIGLATPLSILLLLFVLGRSPWRSKLSDLTIFAAVSLGPLALWIGRNALLGEAPTNRVLTFNPVDYDRRRLAQDVFSQWFLPETIPYSLRVRLAALVLLIFGVVLLWILYGRLIGRRQGAALVDDPPMLALVAMIAFSAVYAVSLVSSAVFYDAATRWDERILSPLYQSMIVIAVVVLCSVPFGRSGRTIQKVAPILVSVGLILLYLPQSIAIIEKMRADGIGFTGRTWSKSEIVEWVSGLPANELIYTNEAQALLFLTEQKPYPVPERVNPVTGMPREDFAHQLAQMKNRLREDGYLVLFHADSLRSEMPSRDEILEGLNVTAQFANGDLIATGR